MKGKRIYEEGSIHSSSFPPLSFTFYLKGFLGSASCIRILQAFSRYQQQLEINLKFKFFSFTMPTFCTCRSPPYHICFLFHLSQVCLGKTFWHVALILWKIIELVAMIKVDVISLENQLICVPLL